MAISGEFVPKQRIRRAHRGVRLLGLVYEELYQELGHEYSTAELLAAAQMLIDISNDEYLEPAAQQIRSRPDYHSQDVLTAIESSAWQVACREESCDNLDDDRMSHNHKAIQRLKFLLEQS